MYRYQRLFYLLLCLLICICTACKSNADRISLQVEKVVVLDSLPSGSGMVLSGDTAWVFSDDATGIYRLSLTDYTYQQIPYGHYDSKIYRIPKPVKPDLEAVAYGVWQGREYLLSFGSGSVPAYRDTLFIFDKTNGMLVQRVSLSGFYTALKYKHGLDSATLNIEGAAMTGKYLYLLNRGRNLLFRIDRKPFEQYIAGTDEVHVPEATAEAITLPVADGLQAGFSGATMLDNNTLLFSASLENITSNVADGTVMGSYIGTLDVSSDKAKLPAITMLKNKAGRALKDKIESLEVAGKYADGPLKLIALVDNDDGSSKLIILKLKR